MEHNEIKEMLPMFVFGELESGKTVLLWEHLKNCAQCREELEQLQKLQSIFSDDKRKPVSEELLGEARSGLRESLRRERSKAQRGFRLLEKISPIFAGGYKLVYTAAASLIIGLTAGYLMFNTPPHIIVENNGESEGSGFGEGMTISSINFIDSDASDGEIEFTFEAARPVRMKGNVNDPDIQRVLTYSMLNEDNAGVRLNSVSLISSLSSKKMDDEVKTALMTVAQYDQNPGVRREALLLLRETAYDDKVKDMLLYILTNDENSALRIEAINSLSEAVKAGHKLNSEEIGIFKDKVERDENSYIRLHAKTVLQELN